MELSPHLKSWINAAYCRPGPSPAPCNIQEAFERIEQEATAHELGLWPWLTISTATVMTMNSPRSLAMLFRYTTTSKPLNERVEIAEYMREIGLRCSGINGLPRTINMLNAFHTSLPPEVASLLNNGTSRCLNECNVKSINAAGQTLWNRIHYPMDTELESKLKAAHPDLLELIMYLYGGLFSDPDCSAGVSVDRMMTSLFAIACLRAQQGAGPQLTGHLCGLKRALDDGSRRSLTRIHSENAKRWLVSDEGCIWILKTVDDLTRILSEGQSTFAMIKAKM